jgi:hypothetical protein
MRFAVFAAAALALTSSAARAEEPGYLFDAIRLYKYKMSWERLLKSVEPIPDWLLHFDAFNGAAGDLVPVSIGGKPYHISYVCEPTNCAVHKFEVLFDAEGLHAWGALGGKDVPPAFYGNPNPAEQEALAKGLTPAAAAETPKAEDAKPAQSKSE